MEGIQEEQVCVQSVTMCRARKEITLFELLNSSITDSDSRYEGRREGRRDDCGGKDVTRQGTFHSFEYRVSEYILLRSFTLYDLQIFTNSPFTDSDSRCEARGEGRGNGGNEVTRQGELFAFDYCHQETHFLFSINFFTFL